MWSSEAPPAKRLCNETAEARGGNAGRVQCAGCQQLFLLGLTQIDHKRCRALGGVDDESNLQRLCPNCHAAKTKIEMTRLIPAARRLEVFLAKLNDQYGLNEVWKLTTGLPPTPRQIIGTVIPVMTPAAAVFILEQESGPITKYAKRRSPNAFAAKNVEDKEKKRHGNCIVFSEEEIERKKVLKAAKDNLRRLRDERLLKELERKTAKEHAKLAAIKEKELQKARAKTACRASQILPLFVFWFLKSYRHKLDPSYESGEGGVFEHRRTKPMHRRMSIVEVFEEYEHFYQHAGASMQFSTPGTLSKKLRKEHGFADLLKRRSEGNFLTTDTGLIDRQIAVVEKKFTTSNDVFSLSMKCEEL